MSVGAVFAGLLVLMLVGFFIGQQRALRLGLTLGGIRHLQALPFYYGMKVALACGVPALFLLLLWLLLGAPFNAFMLLQHAPSAWQGLPDGELALLINAVKNVAAGSISRAEQAADVLRAADFYSEFSRASGQWANALVLVAAIAGMAFAAFGISAAQNARTQVEWAGRAFLLTSASVAILTTVGIVLSVMFESLRFFHAVPWWEFLFGLEWQPQIAMRADQIGSSGAFGAVPLFAGTLLISCISMLVAVPCGLMAAIYLSEYAGRRLRRWMKPILELLAGIPTVVYGFFAALTVAPLVRGWGVDIGLNISSESALVAGFVMGVMIIPFISSLADDVINAVPQTMRDGSYALGATQAETIFHVVIPAALPGIVGGVLLAVSRAIGETMIVVMAAGMTANLTANPFEAVTTVTVQIASLLVGDQEFDSPKTLAAFALGLVLFFVTLLFNMLALHVVKKYREQYE